MCHLAPALNLSLLRAPRKGCRDQFHTRIRHGEPVRMSAYWPRIFANICVFHRGSVYMPAYSCVFVRTCSRTSAYLPRMWRPNRVFPRTCANFAYSRICRISAYIHVYPRCIRRISMYTGPRIVRVFAVYSPRTCAKYTRIRVWTWSRQPSFELCAFELNSGRSLRPR